MTVECDRVGGVNLAQGVCDTELRAPVREEIGRASCRERVCQYV